MAYDERLAERIRGVLARRADVTERRMFGGIAFMLGGNMCCGVLNDDLVLRLGPKEGPKALSSPDTRECDFTGRPMKAIIMVWPSGYATDQNLADWLRKAVDFASSLPSK